MDENVKALLRELGEAINEVVTASPRVADVMQAIRNQGYDIVLTLDANVVVAVKRGRAAQASPEGQLTADDRRFLKRLKIEY